VHSAHTPRPLAGPGSGPSTGIDGAASGVTVRRIAQMTSSGRASGSFGKADGVQSTLTAAAFKKAAAHRWPIALTMDII